MIIRQHGGGYWTVVRNLTTGFAYGSKILSDVTGSIRGKSRSYRPKRFDSKEEALNAAKEYKTQLDKFHKRNEEVKNHTKVIYSEKIEIT